MKGDSAWRDAAVALVGLLIVLAIPLLHRSPAFEDFIIRLSAMALFATSLNLLVGNTGMVSFGHGTNEICKLACGFLAYAISEAARRGCTSGQSAASASKAPSSRNVLSVSVRRRSSRVGQIGNQALSQIRTGVAP